MKSLNFSPDGRQVMAADNHRVVIWDIDALSVRKVIDEGVTAPTAFSDCGKILATPSTEKITLRNTETWEEIAVVTQESPVTCIGFYRYRSTTQAGDPDLIIGREDGTVAVWDEKNRSYRCESRLHKKRVRFVSFISDFDYTSKEAEMVSVGEDRKLVTFRINSDSKPYFTITCKSKVPATSFIDTVKRKFIFADVYGNMQFRSGYSRGALGEWNLFRGTPPVTFTGAAFEFSRPAEDIIRLTALCAFSTSYNDNFLIGYADGTIRFVPIKLKQPWRPISRRVKAELGDSTEIFGAHTDSVTGSILLIEERYPCLRFCGWHKIVACNTTQRLEIGGSKTQADH